MDKQKAVYSYNRILFNQERECSDTCKNMHELWKPFKQYTQVTQGQLLYDSTYMKYIKQTKSRDRK